MELIEVTLLLLFAETSDIEVDRDEDISPQPHHVHYEDADGKEGHYLEVPQVN